MKRIALIAAAWLLAAAPAFAIQQRQIEIVTPRGGALGTTVEVLLQGMDLAGPKEVLFYRGGIEAIELEALPPPRYEIALAHGSRVVEQVRARFRIAPDCPLGEHPFRLRTATGLGTLCTFWVGPFPTVEERETSVGQNDATDRAEPVALNSTVAGKIHPAAKLDRDLYRVALKTGQRLGVEVEALRLCMMAYGDAEHDLMVSVLDAAGHEIARNDDSGLHIQDPLLSVKAPRDGDYFVEVRQRVFKPHGWGFYRLHLGTFARPLTAFPAGGEAGKTLSVHWLGDASGEAMQDVAVPSQPGSFDVFPGAGGERPPSPLALRSSPYPNLLEAEPNDNDRRATAAASLPLALNGVIARPGDVDTFRIPVVKGASYRVRVFARALGTPLDPKIWLRPAGSEPDAIEVEADDSQLRDRDIFALSGNMRPKDLLDPSIVFTPRQGGDYLLGVGDTRGLGGPTSVYRVEIEPVSDGIDTYVISTAHDAFEVNRVTGFIVPQGNRWTVNVSVAERQGNRYAGDLELFARGLPRGVTMTAPRITRGLKMVPVEFAADATVPEQSALIEVLARPAGSDARLESRTQQAIPFVNHSGGHAWHYVALDRFALAVTRPAPFHVELVPPRIALAQAGELTLAVKVVRHGDFDEAVDIQPDWLPRGVAGESAVTVSPGQTEAKFTVHADPNAAPGTYKVAMNATTTGGLVYSGVGRIRVASALVDLTITEPYLTMNIRRTAVERGRKADVVCEVKPLKPFPGKAVASLRGLPNGVALLEPLPRLSAGDTQVTFRIQATPEALVGQYSGIVCEVVLDENGQSIRQQTGSGVLRVDPARSGTHASP